MNLIQHYVNGKIFPGSSKRSGKVFNPATGSQESEVSLGTKKDLDQAVDVASKAFETWYEQGKCPKRVASPPLRKL